MASELSRFIEQELERKGIDPDDDRRNLLGRETFRIESRSHAQENQRKASKTTRNFCVGGGIFLAVVLIIYFLSKSNSNREGPMFKDDKSEEATPAGQDNGKVSETDASAANSTSPGAPEESPTDISEDKLSSKNDTKQNKTSGDSTIDEEGAKNGAAGEDKSADQKNDGNTSDDNKDKNFGKGGEEGGGGGDGTGTEIGGEEGGGDGTGAKPKKKKASQIPDNHTSSPSLTPSPVLNDATVTPSPNSSDPNAPPGKRRRRFLFSLV